MSSQTPLLELNGISKTYRVGNLFSRKRIRAVRDVDIRMPEQPSILAIAGESGSGKSTLAKMILRQERQTNGDIFLNGEPVYTSNKQAMNDRVLRTRIQAIAGLLSSTNGD